MTDLCTAVFRKALGVVRPQFRLDIRGSIHDVPQPTRAGPGGDPSEPATALHGAGTPAGRDQTGAAPVHGNAAQDTKMKQARCRPCGDLTDEHGLTPAQILRPDHFRFDRTD